MVKHISFNDIHVETLESNSGIFIGKNLAMGWDANGKTQEGVGVVKGKGNVVKDNSFYLYDKDLYDTPIITKEKVHLPGSKRGKVRSRQRQPNRKRCKKRNRK